MMYKLKEEMKNELLCDKSATYIANTLGVSFSYIVNILNRKVDCSKVMAWAIVKCLNYENEIEKYFDEV